LRPLCGWWRGVPMRSRSNLKSQLVECPPCPPGRARIDCPGHPDEQGGQYDHRDTRSRSARWRAAARTARPAAAPRRARPAAGSRSARWRAAARSARPGAAPRRVTWCGCGSRGRPGVRRGSRCSVMLIFRGWVPQDRCSTRVRCLKSSALARGRVLRRRVAELCARAGMPRAASPAATGCRDLA
jgi:hypothetical protein